jgi:hypothetical protein
VVGIVLGFEQEVRVRVRVRVRVSPHWVVVGIVLGFEQIRSLDDAIGSDECWQHVCDPTACLSGVQISHRLVREFCRNTEGHRCCIATVYARCSIFTMNSAVLGLDTLG